MKSTPAMRARIRELMGNEQDDYDRAVECVLDDIEALEAARAVDLQTCADQLEQNTATMNTTADRIEALEAALREIELLVTGRAKRLARAALAPPPPPGMHRFTDANGPDE